MGKKLKVKSGEGRGTAEKLSDEEKGLLIRQLMESPIRFRILEWLSGQSGARTKRQIARALSLSDARVHYHLKLLEMAGLVELKRTRQGPRGITEKLYAGTARLTRKREEGGMSDREKSEYYLKHVMHHIADVHREAIELITADWQENRFTIGCYRTFAKPEEFRKLKRRIVKLIEDFHRKHKKPRRDDVQLAITLGLVPTGGGGWRGSNELFDMIS